MADPPNYIDKVNGIVRFIENPCDAPWAVYFETALEPAGEAILRLVTFGMSDVMRGYFRPKGLRSGRHGRRGKRGGIRPLAIPEFGEMIGKRLPGHKGLSERHVSQGVKNLWLIDGVLQRFLWWWLVLDVTLDFFYEWSSLIQETEFCKKTAAARMLATSDTGTGLGLIGWQALTMPDIHYEVNGADWNVASGSLPAGRFFVTVSVKSTNFGAGPQTRECGAFAGADPNSPFFKSGPVTVGPGETASCVASGIIFGPVAFTALQFTSAFTADISDAFMWAQADT